MQDYDRTTVLDRFPEQTHQTNLWICPLSREYLPDLFRHPLSVFRAGDDSRRWSKTRVVKREIIFNEYTRNIHTHVHISPWQNGGDRMPGGAVIRLIRWRVFVASTELPSAALSECTCTCVRLCLSYCVRACERARIRALIQWSLRRSCVRTAREGRKRRRVPSSLSEVVQPSESIIIVIIVVVLVISPICVLSHFNQHNTEEATAGRARFIKLSSILVVGNRRD